jgi:hypothetical protein
MRPRLLPISSAFDTDFIVAGEIVSQKLTVDLVLAALELGRFGVNWIPVKDQP